MPAEVNLHLNQSRVGLILSSLEGGNYASMQYLLCGLPVVTTRNRGGRDSFFHEDYVIWADDNPTSVAQAVSELISRDLDPMQIRAATLDRINKHRRVFQSWVQSAVAPHTAPHWETYFFHKLLGKHSPLQLARLKFSSQLRSFTCKIGSS
jgi:glycosyltransferase involved in cell wall biosynthesis